MIIAITEFYNSPSKLPGLYMDSNCFYILISFPFLLFVHIIYVKVNKFRKQILYIRSCSHTRNLSSEWNIMGQIICFPTFIFDDTHFSN